MLRGGPAVGSVFLCFVCLPAIRAARPCSPDSVKLVNSLVNNGKLRFLDCKLYTPSHNDFKKCPRSTIKCFADEVEVLIQEFNTVSPLTPLPPQFRLATLLKNLARRYKPEKGCLQCENLKEEEVDKFLGDLLSTLEAINSGCSNAPQRRRSLLQRFSSELTSYIT